MTLARYFVQLVVEDAPEVAAGLDADSVAAAFDSPAGLLSAEDLDSPPAVASPAGLSVELDPLPLGA